eukprot:3614495-Amphidinium_carterae.1
MVLVASEDASGSWRCMEDAKYNWRYLASAVHMNTIACKHTGCSTCSTSRSGSSKRGFCSIHQQCHSLVLGDSTWDRGMALLSQ